jgi:copper(I)-binding protein
MSIDISQPWARSVAADSLEAGGFLTIVNRSEAADRLIGASSPLAEKVELHGIKVVGPNIKMRRLERGVSLPAGTTITLKPRGYHLLMQGLKAPLAQGQRVPVTLTFEKASGRDIELVVEIQGPVGDVTLHESPQS